MKRILVGLVALLAVTAAANANMLGAWTQAGATSWGSGGYTYDMANMKMSLPNDGSMGLYQAVAVTPGNSYTITGNWQGDVSNSGWSEVMMFNIPDGSDLSDPQTVWNNFVDGPEAGINTKIVNKVDDWDLPQDGDGNHLYATWGWQSITQDMPAPGLVIQPVRGAFPGTNTLVATGNTIIVALKVGSGGGGAWNQFSNLDLTPEPATALLLLAGLPMLRRRRA